MAIYIEKCTDGNLSIHATRQTYSCLCGTNEGFIKLEHNSLIQCFSTPSPRKALDESASTMDKQVFCNALAQQ